MKRIMSISSYPIFESKNAQNFRARFFFFNCPLSYWTINSISLFPYRYIDINMDSTMEVDNDKPSPLPSTMLTFSTPFPGSSYRFIEVSKDLAEKFKNGEK